MSTPAETKYTGSCHCGQVKYTAELPADLSSWSLTRCNCTMCHKKGYLAIILRDPKTFTLISPASLEDIGSYQFGRKTGQHHFCKNCGTNPFAIGSWPEMGGDYVLINATTIDDVDLSKIRVSKYWDGRNEVKGPRSEPVAPGTW